MLNFFIQGKLNLKKYKFSTVKKTLLSKKEFRKILRLNYSYIYLKTYFFNVIPLSDLE